MASANAFINGAYMPAEEACLNIEDRGTLFGDGVYEFFKVYRSKLFLGDEHLSRLHSSANKLEIPVPYRDSEIIEVIEKLIRENAISHGGVYLQLSRGGGPRNHQFPDNCSPNFFIVAREMPQLPDELYKSGIDAVLLPDERWKRCDIKSLNLLPNILAKEKAKKLGVYDAILYSEHGVTESTSSSVLAVIDGVLISTPPGPWILPGITMETAFGMAKELGIPVSQQFMTKEELLAADEIMLTSTRIDVLSVVKVDNKTVGNGKPGPVSRALRQGFAGLLEDI